MEKPGGSLKSLKQLNSFFQAHAKEYAWLHNHEVYLTFFYCDLYLKDMDWKIYCSLPCYEILGQAASCGEKWDPVPADSVYESGDVCLLRGRREVFVW